MSHPRVGLGEIVINKEGKVLVGLRQGSHAPYYSIPGGHLELGETFEDGARREVKEETNFDAKDLRVIAITNNLETFRHEGLHYISVILLVKEFSGDLKNMEPNKCKEWVWVDPTDLPLPHFDASKRAITCYLESTFYKK